MPCQHRLQERSFGARAARELRRELKEQGVRAEVDAEPIFGTKRWQLVVCAARYRAMSSAERNTFTWSAVRRALPDADTKRIGMIVTWTPTEREPWRKPGSIRTLVLNPTIRRP